MNVLPFLIVVGIIAVIAFFLLCIVGFVLGIRKLYVSRNNYHMLSHSEQQLCAHMQVEQESVTLHYPLPVGENEQQLLPHNRLMDDFSPPNQQLLQFSPLNETILQTEQLQEFLPQNQLNQPAPSQEKAKMKQQFPALDHPMQYYPQQQQSVQQFPQSPITLECQQLSTPHVVYTQQHPPPSPPPRYDELFSST